MICQVEILGIPFQSVNKCCEIFGLKINRLIECEDLSGWRFGLESNCDVANSLIHLSRQRTV
jgi:hypothetical protein